MAAARRDDAFRRALRQAAPEVQNDPATLWTVAAHAWNLGDLKASMVATETLLADKPDDPRARLLKIEILIRQDRSADIFTELEKPIEKLAWSRPDDQFRVASLLGHFGFAERAADLAYHLFLQHRDMSRAWMTLSILVLESGKGDDAPRLWNATEVGPNAAVDLRYNDETETFFVVEPNVALRKLDPESWEPDHPLVRAVTKLRVGDAFTGPDGREGIVRRIRHKYVARLHYVLEHHEARFPEIMGFRSVPVDPKQPGGLDALVQQIKARNDWIRQEEAQYLNGPLPIGVLAHRVGMDTIEVSAGLATHGARLKVATGNPSERSAAEQSVRRYASRGCVLDLLAFWTAWRLGALDAIRLTCGPIHLPQSILDQLRVRREQFDNSARDGLKTAGYDNGKITLHETLPEVIVQLRDEIDHAIAWADANATISPVVASDDWRYSRICVGPSRNCMIYLVAELDDYLGQRFMKRYLSIVVAGGLEAIARGSCQTAPASLEAGRECFAVDELARTLGGWHRGRPAAKRSRTREDLVRIRGLHSAGLIARRHCVLKDYRWPP